MIKSKSPNGDYTLDLGGRIILVTKDHKINLSELADKFGISMPATGFVPIAAALERAKQYPGLSQTLQTIQSGVTSTYTTSEQYESAVRQGAYSNDDGISESDYNYLVAENNELVSKNAELQLQGLKTEIEELQMDQRVLDYFAVPINTKEELMAATRNAKIMLQTLHPEHFETQKGLLDKIYNIINTTLSSTRTITDQKIISNIIKQFAKQQEATITPYVEHISNLSFEELNRVIPNVDDPTSQSYDLIERVEDAKTHPRGIDSILHFTDYLDVVDNEYYPIIHSVDAHKQRYFPTIDHAGESHYVTVNDAKTDVEVNNGTLSDNPVYQKTPPLFEHRTLEYPYSLFAGIAELNYENAPDAPFAPTMTIDNPRDMVDQINKNSMANDNDKLPAYTTISDPEPSAPILGFTHRRFQTVDPFYKLPDNKLFYDGTGAPTPLGEDSDLERLELVNYDEASGKLVIPPYANADNRYIESVDIDNCINPDSYYETVCEPKTTEKLYAPAQLQRLTIPAAYYTYATLTRRLIESVLAPIGNADSSNIMLHQLTSSKLLEHSSYNVINDQTKRINDLHTATEAIYKLITKIGNNGNKLANKITKSVQTIYDNFSNVVSVYSSCITTIYTLQAMKGFILHFYDSASKNREYLIDTKQYAYYVRLAFCLRACRYISSMVGRYHVDGAFKITSYNEISAGSDSHGKFNKDDDTLAAIVKQWLFDVPLPNINNDITDGGVEYNTYKTKLNEYVNILKLFTTRYPLFDILYTMTNADADIKTFSKEYMDRIANMVNNITTDLYETNGDENEPIDNISLRASDNNASIVKYLTGKIIDVMDRLEEEFNHLCSDLKAIYDVFDNLAVIEYNTGNGEITRITIRNVNTFCNDFEDAILQPTRNVHRGGDFCLIDESKFTTPGTYDFVLKITDEDRTNMEAEATKLVNYYNKYASTTYEALLKLDETAKNPMFIFTLIDKYGINTDYNMVTMIRDMYDEVLTIRNAYREVNDVFNMIVNPLLIPKQFVTATGQKNKHTPPTSLESITNPRKLHTLPATIDAIDIEKLIDIMHADDISRNRAISLCKREDAALNKFAAIRPENVIAEGMNITGIEYNPRADAGEYTRETMLTTRDAATPWAVDTNAFIKSTDVPGPLPEADTYNTNRICGMANDGDIAANGGNFGDEITNDGNAFTINTEFSDATIETVDATKYESIINDKSDEINMRYGKGLYGMVEYFGLKTSFILQQIAHIYEILEVALPAEFSAECYGNIEEQPAYNIEVALKSLCELDDIRYSDHSHSSAINNTLCQYIVKNVAPQIEMLRERFIETYAGIGEYFGRIEPLRSLNVLYQQGIWMLNMIMHELEVLQSIYCKMDNNVILNINMVRLTESCETLIGPNINKVTDFDQHTAGVLTYIKRFGISCTQFLSDTFNDRYYDLYYTQYQSYLNAMLNLYRQYHIRNATVTMSDTYKEVSERVANLSHNLQQFASLQSELYPNIATTGKATDITSNTIIDHLMLLNIVLTAYDQLVDAQLILPDNLTLESVGIYPVADSLDMVTPLHKDRRNIAGCTLKRLIKYARVCADAGGVPINDDARKHVYDTINVSDGISREMIVGEFNKIDAGDPNDIIRPYGTRLEYDFDYSTGNYFSNIYLQACAQANTEDIYGIATKTNVDPLDINYHFVSHDGNDKDTFDDYIKYGFRVGNFLYPYEVTVAEFTVDGAYNRNTATPPVRVPIRLLEVVAMSRCNTLADYNHDALIDTYNKYISAVNALLRITTDNTFVTNLEKLCTAYNNIKETAGDIITEQTSTDIDEILPEYALLKNADVPDPIINTPCTTTDNAGYDPQPALDKLDEIRDTFNNTLTKSGGSIKLKFEADKNQTLISNVNPFEEGSNINTLISLTAAAIDETTKFAALNNTPGVGFGKTADGAGNLVIAGMGNRSLFDETKTIPDNILDKASGNTSVNAILEWIENVDATLLSNLLYCKVTPAEYDHANAYTAKDTANGFGKASGLFGTVGLLIKLYSVLFDSRNAATYNNVSMFGTNGEDTNRLYNLPYLDGMLELSPWFWHYVPNNAYNIYYGGPHDDVLITTDVSDHARSDIINIRIAGAKDADPVYYNQLIGAVDHKGQPYTARTGHNITPFANTVAEYANADNQTKVTNIASFTTHDDIGTVCGNEFGLANVIQSFAGEVYCDATKQYSVSTLKWDRRDGNILHKNAGSIDVTTVLPIKGNDISNPFERLVISPIINDVHDIITERVNNRAYNDVLCLAKCASKVSGSQRNEVLISALYSIMAAGINNDPGADVYGKGESYMTILHNLQEILVKISERKIKENNDAAQFVPNQPIYGYELRGGKRQPAKNSLAGGCVLDIVITFLKYMIYAIVIVILILGIIMLYQRYKLNKDMTVDDETKPKQPSLIGRVKKIRYRTPFFI